MVFSSYIFLFVFLPAALLAYYLAGWLPRGRRGAVPWLRTLVLVAASYVFYGWERYLYVGLILLSTVVDFLCAAGLAKARAKGARRAILIVSVTTNLSLLGFFKYRNFALDVFDLPPWLPELTLPVGISFYTFQSMSYTIDVYRGLVKPVPWRRALDFFCYVSMFPQLVAGPIVRFREIQEQLVHRTHGVEKIGRGVFIFMIGFAKKTLIANHVGVLADALFKTSHPGLGDAWIGMLGYTFQIYFDFSGYSDMAIGLGLMLGFTFPENFASPYRSQSITDFWRRWHISLSSWLRDYLYVPLGGNRRGPVSTYRNLALTMLLGGLWHGAAWTFVIWGAWHGGLLALERWLGKRPVYHALPAALRVGCTFLLVMLGWTVFRAGSLEQLGGVLEGLVSFADPGGISLRPHRSLRLPLIALGAAALIAFFAPTTRAIAARITWPKIAFALLVFWAGVQQMLQSGFNPFLYFQF